MPRTKGSKNKPKAINDYASQIAEKQETIVSLNTEIASIQKAIEEQKNTLKEKKSALCILQSPADSDAFQSGRCAKHNGRPETMYF